MPVVTTKLWTFRRSLGLSKSRLAATAGLSVSLLLGACGGSSDAALEVAEGPTPSSETSNTEAAATSGLPTNAVLPTVAGGQLDFGELAGQDLVLWFWAPW